MAQMRFGRIATNDAAPTFTSFRMFEVLDDELRQYKDMGNRHMSVGDAMSKAKKTFPEIGAWWDNPCVGAHGCWQTEFYCTATRTYRTLRIMGNR